MGVYNECIDSTTGRIHVCFPVLLDGDDPSTSWSFQSVAKVVFFTGLGAQRVGQFLVACG